MSYVLGVDLGTSSLKAIVMNKKGAIELESSENYSLIQPKKGYNEQNPQFWVNAFDKVILDLIEKMPSLKTELKGLSISGQMHSLVILDKDGKVLRNAILWNDVRTTKQCEFLSENYRELLVNKTKNIPLEGFTLPKLLWIKENEPNIWREIQTMLLPKDYLNYWLTGNKSMELSDAAGTLMLNVMEKRWETNFVEEIGIDPSILPPLTDSTAKRGEMKKDLLEKYGFTENIQIFSGGADNACAALGAGIIKEKRAMASIGTSGVFLSYEGTKEKNYDGQLHFLNHVIPDNYYSMGVTLSAGQSLSWFKDTFATDMTFDELLLLAESSSVGANGLLFTPFITGERTPYIDSQIRGSFIGIDSTHMLSDFSRAVIEGITYSLKVSKELMENEKKQTFEEIISVGGGAKSSFWMQIQADIFDTKVKSLETEQGPGVGAAMIAAIGLEWFATEEECVEQIVKYKEVFLPVESDAELYKKYYSIYKKIYAQTKDISKELLTI